MTTATSTPVRQAPHGSYQKISWREDKPAEDPEKMKRWGFVSAQPSEFLIHFRGGQIRDKTTGQGKTCFKLPWDTVAIVPTSLKEVFFEANQITRDNVEVRLRGMVVYHVSDPLKIYRLVNFSFRERAEQKLSLTIADMCRSTAKWLVANMTVEECIRKRKEDIANALTRDVARVIEGGNETDPGWGVTIDSIDIQDVYILSEDIFQAMQAEYRNRTMLDAETSRLAAERQVAEKRIAAERETKLLELQAQAETRRLELENQAAAAIEETRTKERIEAAEKQRKLRGQQNDAEVRLKAVQVEADEKLARVAADEQAVAREVERDRHLAELRRQVEAIVFELDRFRVEQNENLAAEKVRQTNLRAALEAERQLHARELAVRGERLAHEEDAAYRRALREVQNLVGDGRLREQFLHEALPKIAEAFGQQFGRIQVTQWSGNGNGEHGPLGVVAGAFQQLLEVARVHGIDLGELLGPRRTNGETPPNGM